MKKTTKKLLIGSTLAIALSSTVAIVALENSSTSSTKKLTFNKAISNNVDGPGILSNESSNSIPSTYFYLKNFDATSSTRAIQWENTLAALNYFKNLPENESLLSNSVASSALDSLIQIYTNLATVISNLQIADGNGGVNSTDFQKIFQKFKDPADQYLWITPSEQANGTIQNSRAVFETEDPNAEIQTLISQLNGFNSSINSTVSLKGNLNPAATSTTSNTPQAVNLADGVPTNPTFVDLGNSASTGTSTVVQIAEIDTTKLSNKQNLILNFSYTGVQNGTAGAGFNDSTSLPETTSGKLILTNENGELTNATSISDYLANLNVFGRWLTSQNTTQVPKTSSSRPEFLNNFTIEKSDSTYKIYVTLKPNEVLNNIKISQGTFVKFGILNTQILQSEPIIQQNSGNTINSIPFFESVAQSQSFSSPEKPNANQKLDVYLGTGAKFQSEGIYIKGVNDSVYTLYTEASADAAGGGRVAPNLEITNTGNTNNVNLNAIKVNKTSLGLDNGVPLESLDITVNSSSYSAFNFSKEEILFNNKYIGITKQVVDVAAENKNYNPIYSLIGENDTETNNLVSKKIFFKAPLANSTDVIGNPDSTFSSTVKAEQITNPDEASLANLASVLSGWMNNTPVINKTFDQTLKVATFDGGNSSTFTNIKLDQVQNNTNIQGSEIYTALRNTFTNYEKLKAQIIPGYVEVQNNPFASSLSASTIISNILQLVTGSLQQSALQLIGQADPVNGTGNSSVENYNTVTSDQLNLLIQEAYSTLLDRIKSSIDGIYAKAISDYLNLSITNNEEKKVPNLKALEYSTSTSNGEIPLFNINRSETALTNLAGEISGTQIFQGIFNWLRKNNFGIGLYSSTSPVINRSEQSFSLNQIFAEFNASDTDYSNLSSSDFFAGDIAENIQIEKALNLYKTLFKFFGVDLNKLQSDSLITGNKIDFSAAANQAENNINISQIVKDMYTNLEPTTKALNFNVFGTNIAVNSYNALVSAANLQLTLENTKTLNPNNTLLNSKIDEQLRENLADVNNLASYAALINQTNVDTFTKEFSDSNINQSVRSKIENSDLTNKPLFVSNSLQSDFGSSLNQSAPIVALTFFALVGLALLSSAGYVLVARRKTITFKNNKGLKITLSSMVVLGILLLVIIVPIAIIL